MLFFTLLIVVCAVLYLYYKVMIIRTKDPLTQEYLNSKSKIFLGGFLAIWGINQYLFYETQISLLIGILLIALGAFQMLHGWKASKHYRNEYQKRESIQS